jgi:hypothetical protein
MTRTQVVDELERQLNSLGTVSDLLLANDGNEVSPSQIAGLLNVFLDNIYPCLNQIRSGKSEV